jgi:phage shock protein E
MKNNEINKLINKDLYSNRQIFPAASPFIHLKISNSCKTSSYVFGTYVVVERSREVFRRLIMFFNSNGCKNIRADELTEKLNAGDDFFLLDVRTPQENAEMAIEGSYLIPLQELGHRMDELPKKKELVVYCRVGNRSAYACSFLARMGYNVKNLEGGIMTWNFSENVSMTRASS